MSGARDQVNMTRATARRLSTHKDIDQLYEKARNHCRQLSSFQKWYEEKLAEISALCEELSMVEKLVLYSSTGDLFHDQGALVLAVAYYKASARISEMVEYTGSGRTRNELPNKILKPFKDAMSLAARVCLSKADKSKCALGKEEYAKMNEKERKEAQLEQFGRILKFFSSAEGSSLIEPGDTLMEDIAGKIADIVTRKPLHEIRSRNILFKLPRLSAKEKRSPEAAESICKIARSQASVFRLIEDNKETLRCFFLQDNETLRLCTSGHPLPSTLLRCFYRVVRDILWERFEVDYSPSVFHVQAIGRYRKHPNDFKISSKALIELQGRYDFIKDIEQMYLDDLLVRCRKAASWVLKKFTAGCSCGTPFHIMLNFT